MVGNTNFLMIYGEYGNGKSHALLWAKNHIQDEANGFDSMVFYVQTLKKEAGKLTFAGALEYDILAKSNLADELWSFRQFFKNRLVKYMEENDLTEEESRYVGEFVESHELANFAKQLLACDSKDKIYEVVYPSPRLSDYEAINIFASVVNLFLYPFKEGDQSV